MAFASLESLGNPFRVHFQNIPDTMETFVHHLYWASALSFFVVAECDRVRSNQIEDEGRQLRKSLGPEWDGGQFWKTVVRGVAVVSCTGSMDLL